MIIEELVYRKGTLGNMIDKCISNHKLLHNKDISVVSISSPVMYSSYEESIDFYCVVTFKEGE